MVILVLAMWLENRGGTGSRVGGLKKSWVLVWRLAGTPRSPGLRVNSVGWGSVGSSAVAAAGPPGGAAARAGPYRGRVRGLRAQ